MAVKIGNTKSIGNMQNIAQKGIEEAGNKIIKNIPLDMIDYHPAEKAVFMLSDIEGLASSIERNGFIGGIDVYLMPNGRYQISSGHRRFEAVKKLGWKTIPAIVTPLENSDKVNRKFIESNINTRNLSPVELSNSIIYYENILLENNFQGVINEELSKVFGMSIGKISQLKAIAKLSDNIKEMAKEENFPYEAFYEASRFGKSDQQKLYDMIKDFLERFPDTELTSVVVKQFINKIKEEIKAQKKEEERKKIQQKAEEIYHEVVKEKEQVQPSKAQEFEMSYNEPVQDIVEEKEDIAQTDGDIIKNFEEKIIEPQEILNMSNKKEEKKKTSEKAESKPIDFDLQLYIGRINNVIDENSIISDKAIIPSIIKELEQIIEKLRNINEKE